MAVPDLAEPGSASTPEGGQPVRRRRSAWRVLRQYPLLGVGGLVFTLVLLAALAAPWLAQHDPLQRELSNSLLPPAWSEGGNPSYWLGTDEFGGDVYSRILYGARVSLLVAVLASLFAGALGVSLGLLAGYYRGRVDAWIMRLVDTQLALPMILVALAAVALLGPSLSNLVLVMGATGWMVYARVVRGVVLSLRERDFVVAARATGAGDVRIILRHVLPNTISPILVIFTAEIAHMILIESGLSFLGLGVPPPTPTWGRMLADGRSLMVVAYWLVLFPGVSIFLAVLGINLLGDGLRDLFDPKLRD